MPIYADLVSKSTGPQNVRVRLPEDIQTKWKSWCESRKISQQDAIESLIRWVMTTDDLVAAAILGQVRDPGRLAEIVLSEIAQDKKAVALHGHGPERPKMAAMPKTPTRTE